MNAKFHKMLMRRNCQSGETLLSAMVGAAILIILVLSAGMGISALNKSRRRVTANEASREMDAAVVQVVAQSFKNYVNAAGTGARCGNINLINKINLANIGSIDSTVKTLIVGKFPGDPDYNRCMSKPIFSAATAQAASTFYECYQVNLNSAVMRSNDMDAMIQAKAAFLQVVVHIKDLQKDIDVPCGTVVANAGKGLEVYYSVKWLMRVNQENMVKSRAGAINVAL